MKKIFLAVSFFLAIAIGSIAQTTTPAKKAVQSKPAKTATAAPLKADGTPDMRYKENQKKAKGPLKKDGTADMRYKANKKKV